MAGRRGQPELSLKNLVRRRIVGDIAYWPPGPDAAVFYRHDGQKIPDPGIIVIGKIDSGVEALNVPGSLKVAIEVMKCWNGLYMQRRKLRSG